MPALERKRAQHRAYEIRRRLGLTKRVAPVGAAYCYRGHKREPRKPCRRCRSIASRKWRERQRGKDTRPVTVAPLSRWTIGLMIGSMQR